MKKNHLLFFCFMVIFSFLFEGCDSPGKVMIIGVDGMEWRIYDELAKAGKLPNFKRIVENGATAAPLSVKPIISPVIWTSIATGRKPSKHGITWFLVGDKQTGKSIPVTALQRKTKAIWNVTTNQNISTAVIGWWASWPAEMVNGFVVTDRMAFHGFSQLDAKSDSEAITYPEELLDELQPLQSQWDKISVEEIRRFMPISQKRYNRTIGEKFTFHDPYQHFFQILATMQTYEKIGLHLLSKNKPRLFMVYFEGVDSAGHLLMKYRPPKMTDMPADGVQRYGDTYDRVVMEQDRILGEFLANMDKDTTLIVCSDHGFKTGADRPEGIEATNLAMAHKWHKKEAFLVMYGRGVKPGIEIKSASVMDIFPTVLYLLGLPIPKDIDGKVLTEGLSDSFVKKHPQKHVDTYEDGNPVAATAGAGGENEKMMEMLTSLGYIGGDKKEEPHFQDINVRFGLIALLIDDKDFEGAENEIAMLEADYPGHFMVDQARAMQESGKGRHEPSLQWMNIAIDKMKKDDFKDPVRLGLAFAMRGGENRQLGQYRQAAADFQSAFEANSTEAGYLIEQAFCLQLEGKIAEAKKALAKACKSPYAKAEALKALALIEIGEGHLGKAKNHLKERIALRDDSEEPYLYLAIIALKEKNQSKARQHLKAAMKRSPQSALAALVYAVIELRDGKNDRAQNLISHVTDQDAPVLSLFKKEFPEILPLFSN